MVHGSTCKLSLCDIIDKENAGKKGNDGSPGNDGCLTFHVVFVTSPASSPSKGGRASPCIQLHPLY